ncbi:hypothetical protein QNI22_35485 [Cytophagaceae bacterium BD1B2-1]|uniref:Tetratricopeptide repeat protein n=2 Tax=Xanthocytophaga agilis TaxID=3048010 RepID=A0AAE3R9A4_9BACT|nr:hypothetical protein [Xanthocytophaga agilis]
MKIIYSAIVIALLSACSQKQTNDKIKNELEALDLKRGDIALCFSGKNEFGKVRFATGCSPETAEDFNMATALLHSFEYTESEKVYARIIEKDPHCIMAYWGAAMCSFHPLWEPPTEADLQKGADVIKLARTLVTDATSREAKYLETIATIYDGWKETDYKTRVAKFEVASGKLAADFPDDTEAAIFHALAIRAAADPKDKTFVKQKQAGDILNAVLTKDPMHPGVAHYIIHVYDYPQLAEQALTSAREYASLAPASAHAQHMPSHIFTRLGLWDESIESNSKSVDAAKCYAGNVGMKGHWDEELHGLDYLMYAYLQKGDEVNARKEFEYFKTIQEVFPMSSKDAFSFGAVPARYVVERRDWKAAAALVLTPSTFSWDTYYWERSNTDFARLLGAVHEKDLVNARQSLQQLKQSYEKLVEAKEVYKSNLVQIQVKAGEGWVKLAEGQKKEALALMTTAAEMEDATEKHPVSPGPIIPARELLGDMYMQIGDVVHALEAYESALQRQPNRFNGLYSAAEATAKNGNAIKAKQYYQKMIAIAQSSSRTEMKVATAYVSRH